MNFNNACILYFCMHGVIIFKSFWEVAFNKILIWVKVSEKMFLSIVSRYAGDTGNFPSKITFRNPQAKFTGSVKTRDQVMILLFNK